MYEIGDLIVYGSDGVCRVESIGAPDISGASKDRLYYTLAPLYRTGKIFTPVDGKVFTRPVITRDEAVCLVRCIHTTEAKVCDTKNLRLLSEHYQAALTSHDCTDLVRLIKAVYLKRQSFAESGRKLGQIDERYLKRAEDLLYGELAVALELERDSVPGYIESAVTAIESGAEWNG